MRTCQLTYASQGLPLVDASRLDHCHRYDRGNQHSQGRAMTTLPVTRHTVDGAERRRWYVTLGRSLDWAWFAR